MKIYEVGGAVRDEFLGLEVKDRDYVVVGATPEEMEHLGYRPVGRDFPVFLHPQTNEEYALARTERKTARGYKGFAIHASPDVTLEQDLARRDFTINAMARDADGRLIDPHGGGADLKAGVLRHVSPAFAEDPVRILRAARFAARFGFKLAPKTMQLMRGMVARGEADALVPERVWQELAKGLMEERPSVMFKILERCGALARIFGPVTAAAMKAVDYAAKRQWSLPVRYAALLADQPATRAGAVSAKVKASAECANLATLASKHLRTLLKAGQAGPAALAKLFQDTDAFRRPDRFLLLLHAAESRDPRRSSRTTKPWPQAVRLEYALAAANSVDAGAIARSSPSTRDISARLRSARVAAIRTALRLKG